MAYNTRKLLHYFRLLPDGRFLFGGRAGTDLSGAAGQAAERKLRTEFETAFPAWKEVEHTHFWRGLACLTRDLVPFDGPLDESARIYAAFGYHGNGVAMGSWCGHFVAGLMAGHRKNAPDFLTRGRRRFPFPSLRPYYLRTSYALVGLGDEL